MHQNPNRTLIPVNPLVPKKIRLTIPKNLMTVLRDGNGVVHFIPNGTINSVSNETHGWSRAVCEIGISHQEDLELVIDLLKNASNELQANERIAPLLLESPSEPNIESLGGSVIALKVAVKTAPNKQGTVKLKGWVQ